MALSVYVASLTREKTGKVTAVTIIRADLAAFRLEFVFDDKGSDENNLHHVQGELQRFSADFSEALRRPLKIAPKPAARK